MLWGVQKYYFPTKKKVNVLRSFDIITCNENCFKIAHIWWHQHMYAMEITYLLWELLLHCISMVMSAMGITFFLKYPILIFFEKILSLNLKKWILFDFVLTYCIGNRRALDYASWYSLIVIVFTRLLFGKYYCTIIGILRGFIFTPSISTKYGRL